jgi:ADP-dependent NAD(P)H-hydrate dehydratase / NAD(P)H-hydrate epimerase
MSHEILTVAQCYEADEYAATRGTPTLILMENAGRAVADEIVARWSPRKTAVLCGPGNNGGDGFVVARLLKERGWDVSLALCDAVTMSAGDPSRVADRLKGDAAIMARRYEGTIESLSDAFVEPVDLVVDAMFGAGLSRPLDGACREAALLLNERDKIVVAIDVPSGLQGDAGKALGDICVEADLTVTFFRKKPAHVLMTGRAMCGEIVVADIGIPPEGARGATLFENDPDLWHERYNWPDPRGHKYARGHCLVVSGPCHATGAARLAARGALRVGAGLVSVASPKDAVAVNAASLTAIMVKPFADAGGLAELLRDERLNAVVLGPGCGVGEGTRKLAAAVLASKAGAVLDADALTSFKGKAEALFGKLRAPAVLTPHEGEFERLFAGLLAKAQSRIEAAREAAKTAGCTVLLKGPDTVIAAPDGRAIVNTNAPPWLATAGSGDVLSGLIGGLLAQGMDSFDAAAAGAWLHGEAANRFGIGLIAEDIPETLPQVLRALHGRHRAAQ